MVKGHTGTLTMRLVRNKLRKRDETCSEYKKSEVKEHQDNGDYQGLNSYENSETQPNKICNNFIEDNQHVKFLRTSGVAAEVVEHGNVEDNPEWTFPPKAPSPHIYHINPEMLVATDKIGFRGFRKQFSGRFKRLVARKLEPAPVIPPELKPQLKTIYVY
ncbi:PREDICTED: uncharacterized protein LOC108621598 [Drosophila arizonae]|uniref:Uncharacterized protein LOC108621598 n=1 Tax=Drosophila arizonae TaxID=7263 RepID=A0ABM1Q4W7_DROAR|nr:PREDICTED: uncharacterized protein LOC108621598 [Drosophila arizonae]